MNLFKKFIPIVQKGHINGVATLDPAGYLTWDQLPPGLSGGMEYQGLLDASTFYPTVPISHAAPIRNGDYWKISVGGNLVGPFGIKKVISKAETSGGGADTKFTATSHGYHNADVIFISGTTSYNGLRTVSSVTANTFVVTGLAFVANETGYAQETETIAWNIGDLCIWNSLSWDKFESGDIPVIVPFTNTFWVDGGRVDPYTEDGSISRPYRKVSTCVTACEALYTAAADKQTTRYKVIIASGTYSDAFTLTTLKHIRFEGIGVILAGNITLTQSPIGGAGQEPYTRIEFVGHDGIRAEKGSGMTVLGNIAGTRTNDSLTYINFKGTWVRGTQTYSGDGTWVTQYENCRTDGAISTGVFADPDSAVLIECTGWNEFAGAISGKVSFYNVTNTDFYSAINVTPIFECRFTNTQFLNPSTVSIIAVKNLYMDAYSYNSLLGRTPTLTGMTFVPLDKMYNTNFGTGLNQYKVPVANASTLVDGFWYKNGMIGIGLDPSQKLDMLAGGIRFSYQVPNACVGTLQVANPGNVDDGAHSYKIVFVNPLGDSIGGAASNVVTVIDKTVSGQIDLTGIPVGEPSVTSRKIYRTKAGEVAYFLVDTLMDNSITIYTDNTADVVLVTPLPTIGADAGVVFCDGTEAMRFHSIGQLTFSLFPYTPSAAPTTDYQVANKKYVDDSAGGGYWDRSGIGLIPHTSGDTIGLTGTRIFKGWFTDLEVTNAIVGSITGNSATSTTAPTTAILVSQAIGQTIGDTTNRLTKLWATDITCTNAITGSITGTAAKATDLVGGNGTTLKGSIPYQDNTDDTVMLSPNITVTKKFLRMTGDGTNGVAPSWDTVTSTDVGLGSVENTALSTWAGTANITTLGTIGTGSWNASIISATKIGGGLTQYQVPVMNATYLANSSIYEVATGYGFGGSPATNIAFSLTKAITAVTGYAYGANFSQTLTAVANNDMLFGLFVKNSYVDGAFTGVKHHGLGLSYQATNTFSCSMAFLKARDNTGNPVVIVSGDYLGEIAAYGYDGTNFIRSGSIKFRSSSVVAGKIGTKLEFYLMGDGATSESLVMSLSQWGALSLTNNISVSMSGTNASFTGSQVGLATTPADCIVILNATASLVGTPVQMSGRLRLLGSAFNSGSSLSENHSWTLECLPAAAAGSTTSQFRIRISKNGGAYTDGLLISDTGNLLITEAGNLVLGTTTGTKFGTATAQKLGFWNATPIVQPITNAYTSDPESEAYLGIDNTQGGSVYAQVTDLNILRVAYDTLRASYDNLLANLKTTGIVA